MLLTLQKITTEMANKYNVGNLVEDGDRNVVRLIESHMGGTYKAKRGEEFISLNEDAIYPIWLNDEFFTNNGYHKSALYEEPGGTSSVLFVANDGYGPAITKRFSHWGTMVADPEYSIAGIIIRSVADFQNLMALCHCGSIADKVTVEPRKKV